MPPEPTLAAVVRPQPVASAVKPGGSERPQERRIGLARPRCLRIGLARPRCLRRQQALTEPPLKPYVHTAWRTRRRSCGSDPEAGCTAWTLGAL